MSSLYYISIQRHDKEPVKLRPGGHGERDLIETFKQAFAERTSLFSLPRTQADLAATVLVEIIQSLKREVLP